MTKHMLLLPVILVAAVALILGTTSPEPWAHHDRDVVPLDEAKIFFEENVKDGDLGIQFFLDGEAWKRIIIYNPYWRKLVDVEVKGNLGEEVGLTELFSESAEPSFDELPREEFLEMFPPGKYRFLGYTIEGDWVVGKARLTHRLPAAPSIISPEDEGTLDPENAVIEWAPGEGGPSVVRYQVVVEFVEIDEETDEETGRVFEFVVDVLADPEALHQTVTVPEEFFESLEELDGEYKAEVVAEERSGNKAIWEHEFELLEEDGE
jgi:hypothetical protein